MYGKCPTNWLALCSTYACGNHSDGTRRLSSSNPLKMKLTWVPAETPRALPLDVFRTHCEPAAFQQGRHPLLAYFRSHTHALLTLFSFPNRLTLESNFLYATHSEFWCSMGYQEAKKLWKGASKGNFHCRG